jgi:membrane fusion protein (multidrug efflux system)
MKSKFSTGGVVAAAMAALLLAGCGKGGKPGAGGPGGGPMPTPEVTVVKVARGPVQLTEDLPGRLEAYRVAQVRAQVDGIVEKRLFREGSNVKAGQTLYVIDPRSYRAAYEAARADVSAAAQVRDRYKQLLEVKAVSQQDYDAAVTRLRQAEAALAKASQDLDNTRVPAPISGHIGRELVTVGALVGHGDATNMAVIEQIDPIYANFVEAGADAQRLKQEIEAGKLQHAGDRTVELVLEDGSIYAEQGKLLFTDQVVDPTTGSLAIRAVFPNHEHQLLPGMFATIRFPQAIADSVIKVPQRAVLMNPQGQYVLVVTDEGKVAPRPVQVGSMAGPDFVIESGLREGEQVIVDGVQKVRPGMQVKAVPLGGTPQGQEGGADSSSGGSHGGDSSTGQSADGRSHSGAAHAGAAMHDEAAATRHDKQGE